MQQKDLDIVAIGNAIVDLLTHITDEGIFERNEVNRGAMTLVDLDKSTRIYNQLGQTTESSGGAAANTIAIAGKLGAKAGFMGVVSDDQLGRIFVHDMSSQGILCPTNLDDSDAETARCMIMVTPDGHRTMCTYLGSSLLLHENYIDADMIRRAKILMLEGYLFDADAAKKAFWRGCEIAKENGTKVAFSLSDPFCVNRHHADFTALVRDAVDIVFANEEEAKALMQVDDVNIAAQKLAELCPITVVTCSEKGAIIIKDGVRIDVPASPIEKLVDTTGAGDSYAGGFLYGYTHGMSMEACGKLAADCAAVVIQQMGARPEGDLTRLLPRDDDTARTVACAKKMN